MRHHLPLSCTQFTDSIAPPQLGKKDVPIHAKAAHIIAISRDITAESLFEALEALKQFTARSKVTANGEAGEAAEKVKQNGNHAVESTEQFVEEHTPGNISYAEAVKEPAH